MITDVKKYARLRMLDLGYVEHEDGLNFENVPSQLFGRAFHVLIGEASAATHHHDGLTIEVPFAIRLLLKGKANMKVAYDEATAKLDEILTDLMEAGNRLLAEGLKNVFFRTAGIDPVAASNDNALIVRVEFTAMVVMGTR